MKTDFHNKDLALNLALKWRLTWTRKWPINSIHIKLNPESNLGRIGERRELSPHWVNTASQKDTKIIGFTLVWSTLKLSLLFTSLLSLVVSCHYNFTIIIFRRKLTKLKSHDRQRTLASHFVFRQWVWGIFNFKSNRSDSYKSAACKYSVFVAPLNSIRKVKKVPNWSQAKTDWSF